MPSAVVTLQLQNQAAPAIRQTADATKALAAEEARAQQATLARAQAVARLQLALGQNASAERTLSTALAGVTTETTGAIRAQIQLVGIQQRAASAASAQAAAQRQAMEAMRASVAPTQAVGAATQSVGGYVSAFKSGLLGIVGPAAVATAAIGLLVGTANSFKQAFSFKAALDESTTSIAIQLRGIRDSGTAFAEAAAFANEYKLTQEQVNGALQSAVGVLRNSSAAVGDVLGVFARLRVLSPEQTLQDAALAVKELQSGDITSLSKRFEISRDAANRMKAEIKGGADAIVVLGNYLDSVGVGMDTLKIGATGAAGAVRDLARAQEELKISQGNIATSQAGIAVVDLTATAFRGLANLLNGDVTTGLKSYAINAAASSAQQQAYTAALASGKTELEAVAFGQNVFNQVLLASIEELALVPAQARNASKSLFEIVPAANAAAAALDGLNSKKVLPHLTDKQNIGAVSGLGANLTRAGNLAAAAAKKTDAEAARLQDARDNLALSRATTSAQRIAELKRQQARTTDPVEKLQLQAQIEQERNSGAKGHTAELGKQLKLNESIYDSVAKQKDALLDIEELAIRDRQQDRADAQKIKTANAILADPRKARLHDAARDVIALADVQDRKRANELVGKGATAGTQLIGGKLYQSVPGGALLEPPGQPARSALPLPPGAPGGAGVGLPAINVYVTLDSALIAANVIIRMQGGLRASDAAGGGN